VGTLIAERNTIISFPHSGFRLIYQELNLQRLLTYMLQGYINSCLSIKVMENSPLLIYV